MLHTLGINRDASQVERNLSRSDYSRLAITFCMDLFLIDIYHTNYEVCLILIVRRIPPRLASVPFSRKL